MPKIEISPTSSSKHYKKPLKNIPGEFSKTAAMREGVSLLAPSPYAFFLWKEPPNTLFKSKTFLFRHLKIVV